jgi:hypothetical protein
MLAVAGLSIFSKPESRSTYDGRPYVVGAPRLAPATVQQLGEIHVNSRTDGCQWTKSRSFYIRFHFSFSFNLILSKFFL